MVVGVARGVGFLGRSMSVLFARREVAATTAPTSVTAPSHAGSPPWRQRWRAPLEVPEEPDASAADPSASLSEVPRIPVPVPTVADEPDEERPGRAEQLGLGVVLTPGPWRLPLPRLLGRSDEYCSTDLREVEARGKILEAALRSHGVETRLVGSTIGPTVTRFELELAPGVKVGAGHEPLQGHRVRDGLGRRPHPRPDPWPFGDRGRGAEREAPARDARRRALLREGAVRAIRSRSRSAATSRGER